MKVMASADENPKPWRLRDALRKKRGLSDVQIDELLATTAPLDLVDLALSLEEEHWIEIADEDFLNVEDTEDSGDWPS